MRKQILEWLGILAVAAAMLFFFASESWRQFGVSPAIEILLSENQ